jgi:chromosome segregation ATPase
MAQIPSEIQKLFDKYPSLNTFAEVSIWDNLAAKEIENLTSTKNTNDITINFKRQSLTQAEQERQQKPAFLRILGARGDEKKLKAEIEILEAQNEHNRNLLEELQSKIDITPNNPNEQTALLKELQLEKKELNLKRREINEQRRQIRTAARQKSANLPNTFVGAFGGSKYRASARRNIRYQKEAALSPHEDAKSNIENEILRLEKDILWVERFS